MSQTRIVVLGLLLALALAVGVHTSHAGQTVVVTAPRLTSLRCTDVGSILLLLNALDQAGTPAFQFAPDPLCGPNRYLVAYR